MASESSLLRHQLESARAAQRLFLGDDGLTDDARLFFSDLATACQINNAGQIYDRAGRTDPAAHVYRDGKRSVWDHIQRLLSADLLSIEGRLNMTEGEYDE